MTPTPELDPVTLEAAAKAAEELIDPEWPNDDLSNQAKDIAGRIRALASPSSKDKETAGSDEIDRLAAALHDAMTNDGVTYADLSTGTRAFWLDKARKFLSVPFLTATPQAPSTVDERVKEALERIEREDREEYSNAPGPFARIARAALDASREK